MYKLLKKQCTSPEKIVPQPVLKIIISFLDKHKKIIVLPPDGMIFISL
jgi:hypothetical protein